MAVSANDIKKKIIATENMSKITKAMQMVSVAKLAKTEHRVKFFREYHSHIIEILSTLKESEYIINHPFTTNNHNQQTKKIGCVIITTNRGLVGGYNNSLFKMLKESHGLDKLFVDSQTESNMDNLLFKYYITGSKGNNFANNELPKETAKLYSFPDEVHYIDTLELASDLINDYLSGEVHKIVIIYQDFISKLTQEATMQTLLPLKFKKSKQKININYEISPNMKDVGDKLLVQYVMTSLYEIFLSANLSEHAARMNAMSSATDNAHDIIKESKLIFNRARQAAITQELNEIVAGANAVN